MEKFKEFEDNTLDDAIRAACKFFDATREKLEIELVQDAKNGIFGLVGARKALIRARLHQATSAVKNLKQKSLSKGRVDVPPNNGNFSNAPKPKEEKVYKDNQEKEGNNSVAKKEEKALAPTLSSKKDCKENSVEETQKQKRAKPVIENRKQIKPTQENKRQKTVQVQKEQGDHQGLDFESTDTTYAIVPLHELDQDKLISETKEVVRRLVIPIIGEVSVGVTVFDSRLDIHIDCGEFSGLIIGREGQTLSSLQYLSSRILSRIMGCLIRVQFDVGDYRERQDDKLREIALSLAERVRKLGRSCSTRPMSSYHRRIIHLTLQTFPDIQTRSSGDGILKRVVVYAKRQAKN